MLAKINKWLNNKWFNFGYMAISFILNEVVQGLGWGMVMLYFVLAAYTTHKGYK